MRFSRRQASAFLLLTFLPAFSSSLYKRYYPGTNIERAAVNKSSTSWLVNVPYDPPEYSESCGTVDTCDVDPWVGCAAFNSYGRNVDRRSATFGKYKVNSRCEPLNPRGRTGVRGRGSLLRFGPNHRVVVIISRNGHPLQYVGKRTDDEQFLEEFPLEFTDVPKELKLPAGLEAVIRSDLSKNYPNSTVDEIIEKAKKKRHLVYNGYYHDERNTDNAWIETWVYQIRDPDSKGLGLMSLEGDNALNLTWKKADVESLKTKIEGLVNHGRLTKGEKFVRQLRELVGKSKSTEASTLLDLIGNIINIVGIGTSLGG